jgi:ferrous iron transport protein B
MEKIVLMGNPNVGKSTIFNKLTHKKQHTGNWAGKTVEVAKGYFKYDKKTYEIIDLPGIYSLDFKSPEEKIAKDYLINETFDKVIVICDATDLHRNLRLFYEVADITKNVILCINMLDEAKRRGIEIDVEGIKKELKAEVIGCSATKDVKSVTQAIKNDILPLKSHLTSRHTVIDKYVFYKNADVKAKDRKIDKLLCGKFTALPVMIIFLTLILWITIVGANYPSALLSKAFSFIGKYFNLFLININTPPFIKGIIYDGAYCVLSEVVSVMLPPMSLFFPIFSLLEESGVLPRIAYNLNKPLSKAGSSGKQALTMCMGLGCNAVGVTGSRIIADKKSRIASAVTNSFIPCNGRFPTLILLISIMFKNASSITKASFLTIFIILSVALTIVETNILSIFMGNNEKCVEIELPSYRKPKVLKTLIDSFINKTLKILIRAIYVAIPAGALLWICANTFINGNSLLFICADFLNPIARLLAMDGVILLAFILGSTANEIVIPIILMAYLGSSTLQNYDNSFISNIFIANGWDFFTALSVSLFSLFHWPCTTTLLTIKKETGKIKYCILSVLLPLITGILLCFSVNVIKLII